MKKTAIAVVLIIGLISQNLHAQYGCGSAVVITDGYSQYGMTTPGTGGMEDWNDNPTDVCGDVPGYWNDDVYLFEYTTGPVSEAVSMTIFTRNAWNGIGIFSDCTGSTFSGCLGTSTNSAANISKTVTAIIDANSTIYIAVGQNGPPKGLDFDVTSFMATAITDPPNCAELTTPADGELNVPIDQDIAWSPSGPPFPSPTSYFLTVGTTPGGNELLDNQDVGNVNTYDLGTLEYSTTYYVTITPTNSNGDASGCTEYSFTTEANPDITVVDCTASPVSTSLCYDAYEAVEITYASTSGNPLNLDVDSGTIYPFGGDFTITDANGTVLYTGMGDNGNLTGISVQSVTDQFTVSYTADFYDCNDTGFSAIDLTISCANCIIPQATYTVIGDCVNAPQFSVEVDLTDLGDATSVDISDDQGSPAQTATAPGTFTFGPYPNGTTVIFSVSNNDDASCTINESINQDFCIPENDDCENAIEITVNEGSGECIETTSGAIGGATPSGQYGPCVGSGANDVWFKFTATSQRQGISLLNIQHVVNDYTNLNLYHALYEGDDCGDLSLVYCASSNGINGSLATGLTVGQTYYIRVVQPAYQLQVTTFDICVSSPAPVITADTSTYTVEQLVTNVLIDNPCAQVSNVTSSTGTDFGSVNGIGYFEKNGSIFPMDSGIILSSGRALSAPGPAFSPADLGTFDWPGDTDLENAVPDLGPLGSLNATIIEFDFVPFVNEMSFDFLFASGQYGFDQCIFSDAFAFLLTDPDGNTTNLAIVPGTSDPISVTTIRDAAYNVPPHDCPSENPEYFDTYYGINGFYSINGTVPVAAPINFSGNTVVLTAQSPVISGGLYHIKLVIADRADPLADSAVFMEAGSFDIGQIDLGDDKTIADGTANCEDDPVVLDTGIEDMTNVTIEWYKDGELIPDENGPTLTVTEPGTYTTAVIYEGGVCADTDNVTIEFYTNPVVDLGEDSTILCGGNTLTLDATPTNLADLSSDVSYTWYMDGTEISGQTNPTLEVTENGAYEADVTTENGCMGTDQIEVDSVDYQISFENVSIPCTPTGGNTSFELAPEITGIPSANLSEVTYEWSTGETTPTITITEDGTYSVTTTYQGCEQTASFDAVFHSTPIIDLGDDSIALCSGDDLTLNATPSNVSELSPDISYTWYLNGTVIPDKIAPNLTISQPGTYEVEVTTEYGCTATDQIEVDLIDYEVAFDNVVIPCTPAGEESSFELIPEITGVPTADLSQVTYVWSTGETTSSIIITDDGTYTVTTTYQGCEQTASFNAIFYPAPIIDLGQDLTTCSLDGLGLDATPSNYSPAETTFSWTYEGNTISETGAVVYPTDYGFGTYHVTAYTDADCPVEDSITIGKRDDFEVTISADNQLTADLKYCEDTDEVPSYKITFTAELSNVPESEVSFTWLKNGEVVNGANDPTYTVDYNTEGDFHDDYEVEVDLDGCSSFSSVSVQVSIHPYEDGCVITQGLSPDSTPGQNDCLDLAFLSDRSGIKSLELFNRYGVRVYEKDNYVDTWCGQDKNGNKLKTGTYYYVLEMEKPDPVFGRIKKGWIYINRSAH